MRWLVGEALCFCQGVVLGRVGEHCVFTGSHTHMFVYVCMYVCVHACVCVSVCVMGMCSCRPVHPTRPTQGPIHVLPASTAAVAAVPSGIAIEVSA